MLRARQILLETRIGGGGTSGGLDDALKIAFASSAASASSASSSNTGIKRTFRHRASGGESSHHGGGSSDKIKNNNNNKVMLIHILKDCLLQQQWARAVSLFDNAQNRDKWRSYHLCPLIEVLRRTKHYEPFPRIWKFMREQEQQQQGDTTSQAEHPVLNKASLSQALATASLHRDADTVAEIKQVMLQRGISDDNLQGFAKKMHERFQSSDWFSALQSMDKLRAVVGTSQEAFNTVLHSCGNARVVRAVLQQAAPILRKETGGAVMADANSYSALIACFRRNQHHAQEEHDDESDASVKPVAGKEEGSRSSSSFSSFASRVDWQGALEAFHSEVPSEFRASPPVYAQLLRTLSAAEQLELCERAVVHMRDSQVVHTAQVIEAVLRCFEARSRAGAKEEWRRAAWSEALSYFSAMRQLSNVKGTRWGYDALVRMYERNRQSARSGSGAASVDNTAQAIADAMRDDGIQDTTDLQVRLINAWSNKRQRGPRFMQ